MQFSEYSPGFHFFCCPLVLRNVSHVSSFASNTAASAPALPMTDAERLLCGPRARGNSACMEGYKKYAWDTTSCIR